MVELAAGTPTTIHCEVSAAGATGGTADEGAANGNVRAANPSNPAILANVLGSFTCAIVTAACSRTREAEPGASDQELGYWAPQWATTNS